MEPEPSGYKNLRIFILGVPDGMMIVSGMLMCYWGTLDNTYFLFGLGGFFIGWGLMGLWLTNWPKDTDPGE